MAERNLDFDAVIDRRNTKCLKYDFAKKRGYPEDVLPLWVADMDFRTSSYIEDALTDLAHHNIYGYTNVQDGDGFFEAVAGWMKRHHGWEVRPEWHVKTPGVCFAIGAAVRSLTESGDGVIIQEMIPSDAVEVLLGVIRDPSFGPVIVFGAGGILSTPLGKGLYGGRPKGNPRYKSLIEGFHALIKNELGAARGHVGGGRGAEPEDAYGMDLEDNRLRRIASALEASRPGILDRLALPYMPWSDYWELARAAYDDADRRQALHHAGAEQQFRPVEDVFGSGGHRASQPSSRSRTSRQTSSRPVSFRSSWRSLG